MISSKNKPTVENWTRYGRALGRASANVVHEVNAPLGVALARVQLALRLLDELRPEQAAALDEQLRSCEAAIRSSASVVRDLNYLRQDLASPHDATSLTHVINAAYQLALPDAIHSGCEMTHDVPMEAVPVTSDPQDLLVLILELLWDRIAQGAKRMALKLKCFHEKDEAVVRFVIASDLQSPAISSNQVWLESLAASCGGRIHSKVDHCGRYMHVLELSLHNQINPCQRGVG